MRALIGAIALGVCGCGPQSQLEGYLLLDSAARGAGFTVEVDDWRGAPLLPVRSDAEGRITLSGPLGAQPLEPRAGSLLYVRGASGTREEREVGVEVSGDALWLHATSFEDVDALAQRLGAAIESHGDAVYRLTASELLPASVGTEPGPSIDDVWPELLATPLAATKPSGLPLATGGYDVWGQPATGARPSPAGDAAVADSPLAPLVGIYVSCEATLLLDASGGFSLDTADRTTRGAYFVEGEELVLGALRLKLSGTSLLGADGTTLAPVEEP